jgi:two-component SAPR family response regulator
MVNTSIYWVITYNIEGILLLKMKSIISLRDKKYSFNTDLTKIGCSKVSGLIILVKSN